MERDTGTVFLSSLDDVDPTGLAEDVVDAANVGVLVQPHATDEDADNTGNNDESISHAYSVMPQPSRLGLPIASMLHRRTT